MFTGIIKRVSKVKKVSTRNNSLFIFIKKPKGWRIKIGESISMNGICSTVRSVDKEIFEVEYMPETIKKTTAGDWDKGFEVNLEKSLRMNDLLDGHIVQGHIDTRGKIIEIKKVKESKVMKIRVPKKFMNLIANKGSIAVDGISMTVVDTGKDWFTMSVVGYTLENTNLGNIKVGTGVNIETDVLAKYLYKITKQYAKK